jgi:ABC-type polysaccharide/polyol phosphate transport system ATPase subunit
MSDIVIRAENLGKRYRIGEQERYVALRDVLTRAVSAPARLFRPRKPSSPNGDPTHIWALKDVSFEVRQGEMLGIIGRNGAGKTTLLKILARVTRPTIGHAWLKGRVGSLLEVGTGFHPELTGRENVYLSGAILGMGKKEIDRKFDEIVAFSEVEKFIDTPLKHYSTGMQMRLAFAVAAHLEPEILLVDEVLSVGDIQFQKKCLGKMGDVAKAGRTVLFVSHQMNQVRRLCERAMWVEAGRVQQDGSVPTVLAKYEVTMTSGSRTQEARSEQEERARFRCWEIVEPSSSSPHLLDTLGPVCIRFVVELSQAVVRGHHGIGLFTSDRHLVWGWAADGLKLPPGLQEFKYTFPMLPLKPGPYYWFVSLWDDQVRLVDWDCEPEMIVATNVQQHPHDGWNGVLNIPCAFAVSPFDDFASEVPLASTPKGPAISPRA